jgi:hypothetical protein
MMPRKDPEARKQYYLERKEQRRAYYLAHKEEHRVRAREYDAKHRKERAEYARQARLRRPEVIRQQGRESYKRKWHWFITKRFGITLEEYQTLVARQGGVCAICKEACKQYARLSVDHDHKTNIVRGLLCNSCNVGLGKFCDNVEKLKSAIAYLEK